MKKLVLILLVLSAAFSAFAIDLGHDARVGISVGNDWTIYNYKEDGVFLDAVDSDVSFAFSGAYYFGEDDFKIGIAGDLTFGSIGVYNTINGKALDMKNSFSWVINPDIGFAMKYDFGKIFSLEGVVGLAYVSDKNYYQGVGNEQTGILQATLDCALTMDFDLLDGLGCMVGANLAVPFYGSHKTTEESSYHNMHIKGVAISPYVGIFYSFD